jgi:hypothetical protein
VVLTNPVKENNVKCNQVEPQFNKLVHIQISVTGTGSVTGMAGINCSSSSTTGCSAELEVPFDRSATVVGLTANVPAGAEFGGWTGDCGCRGTNPTCGLAMNTDHTTGVSFHP